jgi:hypothetical protein
MTSLYWRAQFSILEICQYPDLWENRYYQMPEACQTPESGVSFKHGFKSEKTNNSLEGWFDSWTVVSMCEHYQS